MTTAVLVDDEPTLLEFMEAQLRVAWPDLEVLGTAANGTQAIALCRDVHPDVVFLDIQMPGISGLQVAEHLSTDIQVVFVTAYDRYAVNAFESAAVDYLLKPVTAQRLGRTAARLKSREQSDRRALRAVLSELSSAATPASHLRWLRTGLGDTTELVSVDDVVYFRASQKYTSVMCAEHEYLVRTSIKALAETLDPEAFWQVHRGIVVRVDQVLVAERDLRGRFVLTLRDRPERLRTSAAHANLFKQM